MKINWLLKSVVQKRTFVSSFTKLHINDKTLTNNGDINESIFFGVNAINRYSFLRSDAEYIKQITRFPSTRLVFFNKSQPLCRFENNHSVLKLLRILIQELSEDFQKYLVRWSKANEQRSHELFDYPSITFLGMDRKSNGIELNSHVFDYDINGVQKVIQSLIEDDLKNDKELFRYKQDYVGVPYLAIDISTNKFIQDEISQYLDARPEVKRDVVNFGQANFTTFVEHLQWLDKRDASVFSQGKMFLEWLAKNKYCSGCGSRNLVINGGAQLKCTSTADQNCIVSSTPSVNVSHPRTDVAIISSVTNAANDKILLTNSKKLPLENLYTCVAGFMDPGETIETCVTREIWEETNVLTEQVRMVLSQPWPYPGTLMVGCCGITEFNNNNEIIHLGHDNELRDARWFDFDYIREVIAINEQRELKVIEAIAAGDRDMVKRLRDEELKADFLLPVKNTVALELIRKIVC